jgi:2-phosphoglycerate kinase
MIYLIGGVPRCGKTTLARTLSKKLGISMVPADYLNSAAMAYVSDEEFAKEFPLRSARDKYKGNDLFYSTFTPEQITDLYVKQAETAWKGIQRFVEYALSEKQDYVIEGYQIQPEAVSKLKDTKSWSQIKTLFLYKENP